MGIFANNNLNPHLPKFKARIGLGRNQEHSGSFKEIRLNTVKCDNALAMQYIRHPFNTHLSKVGDKNFEKDVNARVDQLQKEVNVDVNKLKRLFLASPYVPFHAKWPSMVQMCFGTFVPVLIRNPLLWLFLFFAIVVFTALYMGSFILGLLLDIVACRLFCRGSAKEQEWVRQALDTHPELDGDLIDEKVSKGMQEIVQHVRSTYPHLSVIYFTGVERIDNGSKPDWYMEEFMLMVLDPADYATYQQQEQHQQQQSYATAANWVATGSVVPVNEQQNSTAGAIQMV